LDVMVVNTQDQLPITTVGNDRVGARLFLSDLLVVA
jgi:hypothetical protein